MDIMNRFPGKETSRDSSPDLSSPIEDDTVTLTYQTVATVPLQRDQINQQQSLNILPLYNGYRTQRAATPPRLTQPTQLIEQSPDHLGHSSPTRPPFVQVAASSPAQPPPSPARRPSGILANLMAPAGTAFRKPYIPPAPKPVTTNIDSDDEGPLYKGGSSDSDGESLRKNDIKPSRFVKKNHNVPADKVEESPPAKQGLSRVQEITAGSFYKPTNLSSTVGVKRISDSMASAYGNVSKKPRQQEPSRAMPVPVEDEPDLELDDISDVSERFKVKRMVATLPNRSVRECVTALRRKRNNFDDAMDYLMSQAEEKSRAGHIDLTLASDDELQPTPAQRKPMQKPVVEHEHKQQAKKPMKSIQEKYGSTQHVKIAPKTLHVFDTPQPAPEKKKKTLVRGRKHSSSLVPDQVGEATKQVQQIDSGDSDEADSGIYASSTRTSFHGRLLKWFNECTAADLADTASIDATTASYLISKRPFRSLEAVNRVQGENNQPSKSRRKQAPLGEKIYDKCEEMLESYEAVDFLVEKCEKISRPLAAEMKRWGVNVYGTKEGELDIVSLRDSQRPGRDSGIGTPVSDRDEETLHGSKKSTRFVGQPAIMSPDIEMKDYQVVGVNWLALLYKKGLSCILADDMGLGKTCQVIAFLAHLFEIGEKGPHLVVVPAATLENWLQEFQRFCPNLAVEPYYGTQPERLEMQYQIDANRDNINVVVTTYTVAKGKDDLPWLKRFGFTCTVFDEGHVLKNAESDLSIKLGRIESSFRLLLTGTPLQNNLKELISLLAFLMPDMFKEKQQELHSIFTHKVKALDANHEALLSAQRITRARSMLTPFILRRKKGQVLKDLPKKERRVEYCDMTPAQLELYNAELARAYDIRERRANGEDVMNESANVLMKLRQAAIHPFLFRRHYKDSDLPKIAKACLKVERFQASNPNLIVTELVEYSDLEIHQLCDEYRELNRFCLGGHQYLDSGKVQKMLELLRTFMAQGHRTLIFSQFVMVLNILEIVLEREAISFFRLDGTTKVAERQDLIDEFSDEGNTTPVFLLSTKAGGAGINLAKASRVIVFDSGFNPQDDVQAENRAHRIGQTKEVEVVRLISRGTVEEQIYAMGITKLRLDEQVAGDEEGESKKEAVRREEEGRKKVEEMFFRKLEEEPKPKLEVGMMANGNGGRREGAKKDGGSSTTTTGDAGDGGDEDSPLTSLDGDASEREVEIVEMLRGDGNGKEEGREGHPSRRTGRSRSGKRDKEQEGSECTGAGTGSQGEGEVELAARATARPRPRRNASNRAKKGE